MSWNTRFNPTVNGELHVGHLYTILVNYTEAVSSGGKFVLRFDDTQWSWNYLAAPGSVDCFRARMKYDLDWLGIEAIYESQERMMPKVEDYLEHIFHYNPAPEKFFCEMGTELAGCKHRFYPYTDRLTVEKVIMDAMEAINWLIRGMDLITEDCLYLHYCAKMNIPPPRTSYIPRLYFEGDVLSKTDGSYKIQDFRDAGMQPDELISHLAADCLIDEKAGWFFRNVKEKPILGYWAMEAMNAIRA